MPKRKKKKRRLSLKKTIVILSSVFFIAGGLLFAYVDRRVRSRVRDQLSDSLPGIYSDVLFVSSAHSYDVASLKNLLLARGYIPKSTQPSAPGEFSEKAGVFNIHTRPFRAPDATLISSTTVRYDALHRTLHNEANPELAGFYLEPELISALGSNDVRHHKRKSLEQIPLPLQQAVIAIEDERFYSHLGVDIQGISRALWRNVRALSIVEGGSTITQQYARNILFSPKRTLARKVMEALAAVSIELHLSKKQILESYLNEVYLGQEGSIAIHGVPEAARRFFGKDIEQINLSEAALLAGLIQAPSRLSPRKHPLRANERKEVVLQKMAELQLISREELQSALRQKLNILPPPEIQRSSQHFTAAVREQLGNSMDLQLATEHGVAIYTTIHPELQRCAENGVKQGLAELETRFPSLSKRASALEAALLGIEPHSGKILAWVGGRDFQSSQFNHINQSRRQAGSTIKPFVYLTALDSGLNDYKVATTMSIIPDKPYRVELVTRDTWEPLNFDKKFRGDVTLRYALENSLNIPAAYVGQKVGLASFVKTLKKFHLAGDITPVPSLALGALDVSLLDLTAAYAALANGGRYVKPRYYITAVSQHGDVLLQSQIDEKLVANEAAVAVLTNILQGVIERGTGKAVRARGVTQPLAGKTGTSDSNRDAWFVGYTPLIATGVWVGSDDNSETGLTGSSGAIPIWTEFMKCSRPYIGESSFILPPGVEFVAIDSVTGAKATEGCPGENIVKEIFVRGTEPVQFCPLHDGYGTNSARSGTANMPRAEPQRERGKRRRSLWEILFD